MTADFSFPALTALWLGILTAISPCPLASNIAAVSYLGKEIAHAKTVLWCGLAYVLGRTLVYTVLGILLVKSLVSAPGVSFFLQKHGPLLLGPALIIVGLFLLRVIRLDFLGFTLGDGQSRFKNAKGVVPSFFMGGFFALSFCPVSAALFFGTLVPLAAREESAILLPVLFGAGTGLPVALFAGMVAFGLKSAGQFYHNMAKLEKFASMATGVIFIAAGLWASVKYLAPLL